MDQLKNWMLEVAIKKMGPSLIRGVLAAGIGFLVAHSGMLESVGVVYDRPSNTLMIHFTALTEWAVALGLGTATAFLRAGQHHVEVAISPKPTA